VPVSPFNVKHGISYENVTSSGHDKSGICHMTNPGFVQSPMVRAVVPLRAHVRCFLGGA